MALTVEVACQRCGRVRRGQDGTVPPLCRDCKGLPDTPARAEDAYELGWTLRRGVRVPVAATEEPAVGCNDCGEILTWEGAVRCRSCANGQTAALDDVMSRLRRNLAATVPTCSCGCLLAHADELCPACGVQWAERDVVRASWGRDWWAA